MTTQSEFVTEKEKKEVTKTVSKKDLAKVTFDIKPEDIETNLDELEKTIRALNLSGTTWLGSEKIDICYGLQKIRIVAQYNTKLIDADTIQDELNKLQNISSIDLFAVTL
jgi:translation elongation factor EF-1beta